MKKSYRKAASKVLSLMLIASLLAPETAPLAAYGAEAVHNMPRYVSFVRPSALTLEDVGISDSGNDTGSSVQDEGDPGQDNSLDQGADSNGDSGAGAEDGGSGSEDGSTGSTDGSGETGGTEAPEETDGAEETSGSEETDSPEETEETDESEETSPSEETEESKEPDESTEDSSDASTEAPSESETESASDPSGGGTGGGSGHGKPGILPEETLPAELALPAEQPEKKPDKELDIASDSEAERREPEFFYEDLINEPDGILVQFNDRYRTYQVGEGEYVTILGGYSGLYEDEYGQIQEADNYLSEAEEEDEVIQEATGSNARRLKRMAASGTVYRNGEGPVSVLIPEEMGSQKGYTLTKGGDSLEIIPVGGDYTASFVSDNAIRYSDVFENVDVQYTVLGDTVKEDIILLDRQERNEFSYRLKSSTLKFKKQDDAIIAYRTSAKEPLFYLTAPMMADAAGCGTDRIKLSYNSSTKTMTLTADKDWLDSEEREYPVRIDPGAMLVKPSDFSYAMVGSREENDSHLKYFGDNGHTMIGYSEDYGYCRAFMEISPDWESLIKKREDELEAGPSVSDVQLTVTVMTKDTVQRSAFIAVAPEKPWDQQTISWYDMRRDNIDKDLNNEPLKQLGEEQYSEGAGSKMSFNITEAYNKWLADPSARHGLMLKVLSETEYTGDITSVMWAETIYNGSDPVNGPRLEVAWQGEINDQDLKTLPMSETSLYADPGVMPSDAGGRSTLGVVPWGVSQAGADISYRLLTAEEEEEAGSGNVKAEEALAYPDFWKISTDCINNGYLEGNWQGDPAFLTEDLEMDTIYYIKAQGTGKEVVTGDDGEPELGEEDEESPELTSDEFLLYEVQVKDDIARIAKHYGVLMREIKDDNQMGTGRLTTAGDILFIRNPQTSEPYTYKIPKDKLEKYLLESIVSGRDPRYDYDGDPINMSNGSYYMEQTDAELEDLGGTFRIARSYNSKNPYFRSEFGKGWSSLVGENIMVLEDGRIFYSREDGKGIIFEKQEDGTYKGPEGYDYTLEAVDSIELYSYAEEDEAEPEEATPSNAVLFSDELATEAVEPSIGWKLSQTDGTEKTFNAYGLLVTEKDRKGFKTSYAYDSSYQLREIVTPSGKVFGITQEPEGLITEIQLPDGGTIHYEYDDQDNLVSVTNPEGAVRRYEYDDANHMTAWYTENGDCYIRNTYDEDGRVIRQEDGLGSVST